MSYLLKEITYQNIVVSAGTPDEELIDGFDRVLISGSPPSPGNPAYCVDVPGGRVYDYVYYSYIDPFGRLQILALPTGTWHVLTVHTCYPEVPATPDTRVYRNIPHVTIIPGSDPTYKQLVDRNVGWTGSAISVQHMSATQNVKYTFEVPVSTAGIITGFNAADEGSAYAEIEHGWYVSSGVAQVIENGTFIVPPATAGSGIVTLGSSMTGFAAPEGTTFAIIRRNGVVTYHIDDHSTLGLRTVYTSALPSTAPIFVDASVYMGGDEIVNAALTLFSVTPPVELAAGLSHGTSHVSFGLAGYTTGHLDADPVLDWHSAEGEFVLDGVSAATITVGGETIDSAITHADASGGVFALEGEAYALEDGHAVSSGTSSYFTLTTDGAATAYLGTYSYTSFRLVGESNADLVDGHGYASGFFELVGVSDTFDVAVHATAEGTIGGEIGLVGEAYADLEDGHAVSNSSQSVFALTGASTSGLITPQFAYSDTWLQAVSFSYASMYIPVVASGAISLRAWAADHDFHSAEGAFHLDSAAYDFISNPYHSALTAVGPTGRLFAIGHNGESYGLEAVHGGSYSLVAKGGAQAALTGPEPSLTISATLTTLGEAELTTSAGTLVASGTTTTMGRLNKAHKGKYSVLGRSGGICVLAAPVGTLLAAGTTSDVGAAQLTSHAGTLLASGFTTNIGRAYLTSSPLRPAPYGALRGVGTPGYLVATGYGVLSTEYEGYSLTLLTLQNGQTGIAATRFTQYPFERLLRWKDKYYGLADDGLFELTGDTFDEAPIVAEVETAETDFGRREHKRAPSLYLSGRVGADFDTSVVSSEDETNQYFTYRPVSKGDASTHRVQFGKGIKYTYIGYKFTNVNGEDFAITSFTPEVDTLKRSI